MRRTVLLGLCLHKRVSDLGEVEASIEDDAKRGPFLRNHLRWIFSISVKGMLFEGSFSASVSFMNSLLRTLACVSYFKVP